MDDSWDREPSEDWELDPPLENRLFEIRRKIVPQDCEHPARRLYAWFDFDDQLCVGCSDCGEALKGETRNGQEIKLPETAL